MKKNRPLIFVLVLAIVLSLFSGCGSKEKIKEVPQPASKNTESTKEVENQKNETPGTELSTFITNYSNAKGKVWDAMSKKFEESQNLSFAMGALGFAFADLAIIDIPLFDGLTVKDGDSYRGKLLLSGIDAWKKVKGDIIEFGYDFTYKEDKNNRKSGDHDVTSGKFDKKNNTLYYERISERDNKKVSRMVVEIVQNSDNCYSSQLIFLDSQNSDNNGLGAYMTWFGGEDIVSVIAEKKTSDLNFSYNSILNKKNAKPEEMASGMNIVSKASFVKGAASYEETEQK